MPSVPRSLTGNEVPMFLVIPALSPSLARGGGGGDVMALHPACVSGVDGRIEGDKFASVDVLIVLKLSSVWFLQ